jgi:rhamnose transport system permease protein
MMRRILFNRETILFALLVLLFVAFSLLVDNFFDWNGLFRRSRYWVAIGMVAVPMTFIIATAGIDLSVGSIAALCGIVLGMLVNDAGWSVWLAAFAAVAVGTLAGALNGGISSYVGVQPLVVTLATMAMFRGVGMGMSKARSLGGYPEGFRALRDNDLLQRLGFEGAGLNVPVSLVPLVLVFVVGWFLMRKTWVGRFTECIGENPTAAEFAAIDVRRLKFWLYTACGAVCGLAAIFYTALASTAKADALHGMELDVIACVVIGGTRISGGRGSIIGSLLGLLIIGILKHGLSLAGVEDQYIIIYLGIVLVATVVANEWVARRMGGRT